MSSLLLWGDDRTSVGFDAPPAWFGIFKITIQIFAIIQLFLPLRLRRRPELVGIFIAIGVIFSTFLANPTLEAEFILLNSSLETALISIFLFSFKPSNKLEESDIYFLFYMFLFGFIIQILLYYTFGRMPSHSIEDFFIRFNGITNDSLSTGIILSLFIPLVLKSDYKIITYMALFLISVYTGSLFCMIIIPLLSLIYSLYKKLFKFFIINIFFTLSFILYFYTNIVNLFNVKYQSILTHLQFYFELYPEVGTKCDEEFCESFIQASAHLSLIYTLFMYALLFVFIINLIKLINIKNHIMISESLILFSISILMALFVHPVPLIPFVIPLFIILTTLHLEDSTQKSNRRLS